MTRRYLTRCVRFQRAAGAITRFDTSEVEMTLGDLLLLADWRITASYNARGKTTGNLTIPSESIDLRK
jgi:hypothetical protein